MDDKCALRRALLEKRRRIGADPKVSAALFRVVLERAARFPTGTMLGLWVPIRGEPDVLEALLTEYAPSKGRLRFALPYAERNGSMRYFAWSGEMLRPDPMGIPSSVGGEEVRPDALLIPCVGYSCKGHRLGYGAGFFDRYLAMTDPKPLTVGVVWSELRVPVRLFGSHDVRLDEILTENGAIEFERND